MAAKHQYFDLPIPKGMPADVADDFADDVIEFIKRRSESGKDKDGNKFVKYTPDYASKKGVARNAVDLTLSGDMLASIDKLEQKRNRIRIGFEKGSEENAKAEGNILGSYGRTPNPAKARDFLGISERDYRRILKKYDGDY